MVLPVIAAGVIAAGALAQYLSSEEGRRADAKERKRIQAIFDKIQSPDFTGQDMEAPDFDFSWLSPEEYQLVRQHVPQIAPLIEERNPEIVRDSAAGLEGREAQLGALRKLAGIAQADQDPEFMAKMNQAQRRAQMEAQSRGASIASDFAQRGVLGSGLQASLQQQASANALDQAAMTSQDAAAQAYKNRLNAILQSGELGGNILAQDRAMSGQNAGIINAFNQRVASNAQNWANNKADTLNSADRYNIGNEQDVANRNVGTRNDWAWKNRQRDDNLRQYQGEWNRNERNYGNDMAQRGFDNSMSIARGQAGLSDANRTAIAQNTQDRNTMFQGISQAGAGAIQGYGAQQASNRAMDREDDRAFFQQNGRWMTPEETEQRRRRWQTY